MNYEAWLTKLIAFDTTSRHSNLSLIYFLRDWLTENKLQLRLTYHPNKEKANLLATIPANNGDINGGLILSGHTDVVPVDGQAWDTDPFIATKKDNRIYGRGTCDMKGFIAVVLSLIPYFKTLSLKKPLHLAFSYDEEVGCVGARELIADMLANDIKAEACIVGEPSEMKLIIGHKGANQFHCRVHGNAAHSSLTPQGCNAIEYAAELIFWIRRLANDYQHQALDNAYDVPFTTISTNLIGGGTAGNIIPNLCEFFLEFRNLAAIDPQTVINKIKTYIKDELLPKMRNEYADAKIELFEASIVPGFEGQLENKFTKLLRTIASVTEKCKVAYATEAGLFQKAGINTIVCGPGNIREAHRANEFIEIEQLQQCDNFLRELTQKFLC